MTSVNNQIIAMFDENKLDECKEFIESYRRLTYINKKLMYSFHLIQAAGIFITTISQTYQERYLVWLGIGLNVIASLLRAYESMNEEIIKKSKVSLGQIRLHTQAHSPSNLVSPLIESKSPGQEQVNTLIQTKDAELTIEKELEEVTLENV